MSRSWCLVVTCLGLAACTRHSATLPDDQDAAAASPPALPPRSPGCGQPASADSNFAAQRVRVAEHERTYHVRLPDGYDPERAYPVVFRWHGAGGDGLSGGLGIESSAAREAIIVAADGLGHTWSVRSEENDLALFDAMLRALSERYCIDGRRLFSYGFSAGGGLTNLLGCVRAAQLRGTAAIASFDRGLGRCQQPMASWFLHDLDDEAAPVGHGRSARDRMLQRNRCSTQTVAISADCVRYEGCRQPVVWCETRGLGHNIAGETAPAQVWAFFRGLP